jgi:hypothetical protein
MRWHHAGGGALARVQETDQLEMAAPHFRAGGPFGGPQLLFGAARIISPVVFHDLLSGQ